MVALNEKRIRWDKYYLKQLEIVKDKSKDNSTKVGSIIVGAFDQVVSTGFNGFPHDVYDDINDYPHRYERPLKYNLTVHAECNAICLAARTGTPLNGSRIYCNLFPCTECAKMIIQAGIIEVITYKAPDLKEWNFDISKMMFEEAKIKVTEYEIE